MIDLHIHSTGSDGKLSPKELIDWAIEKKLSAIAITDHDNVSGIPEAIEYSKDKNIEVIPGVEFSAKTIEETREIHIIGLFIDYKNKELNELIKKYNKRKKEQKIKMIEKLNKLGYKITFEELDEEAKTMSYGRPHIARILLRKYPDKFKKVQDVFDELIGNDKPAYVSEKKEEIREIVKTIHLAGGIAILAHPGRIGKNWWIVFNKFLEATGDGIEVNYSYYKRKEEIANHFRAKFRKLAEEKNLLISGGGDFHEHNGFPEIGDYGISDEEFDKLKKAARAIAESQKLLK